MLGEIPSTPLSFELPRGPYSPSSLSFFEQLEIICHVHDFSGYSVLIVEFSVSTFKLRYDEYHQSSLSALLESALTPKKFVLSAWSMYLTWNTTPCADDSDYKFFCSHSKYFQTEAPWLILTWLLLLLVLHSPRPSYRSDITSSLTSWSYFTLIYCRFQDDSATLSLTWRTWFVSSGLSKSFCISAAKKYMSYDELMNISSVNTDEYVFITVLMLRRFLSCVFKKWWIPSELFLISLTYVAFSSDKNGQRLFQIRIYDHFWTQLTDGIFFTTSKHINIRSHFLSTISYDVLSTILQT